MTVTVSDAIQAMQTAISKLEKLDPDTPVYGNFDQGGYMDCGFPVSQFAFSVSAPNPEELEEEDIDPFVEITAHFHSQG